MSLHDADHHLKTLCFDKLEEKGTTTILSTITLLASTLAFAPSFIAAPTTQHGYGGLGGLDIGIGDGGGDIDLDACLDLDLDVNLDCEIEVGAECHADCEVNVCLDVSLDLDL